MKTIDPKNLKFKTVIKIYFAGPNNYNDFKNVFRIVLDSRETRNKSRETVINPKGFLLLVRIGMAAPNGARPPAAEFD